MSTAYDFELTINLKLDVPDAVLRVLEFLFIDGKPPPSQVPDHVFFSGPWKKYPYVSWVTEESACAGIGVCALRQRPFRYNASLMQYTLHLRGAAKLESIAEDILVFARWVAQWSMQDQCVGYFKSEDQKHPCLLYFHDDELYLLQVDQPPLRATDGSKWE